MKIIARFWPGWLAVAIVLFAGEQGLAAPRAPLPPLPDAPALYYEGFDEPYVTDQIDAEVVVPGLGNFEASWSGYALQRSGSGVTAFVIPASGGGGD